MVAVDWRGAATFALTGFAASGVEFVEALTVILAAGLARGWRDVLRGAAAAVLVLVAATAVFGSAFARLPLRTLRFAFGAALLLFGLRWLRRAVLRAAGVVAMRDERATFARVGNAMRREAAVGTSFDAVAFLGGFQPTLLEGAEVVLIVLAVGAGAPGMTVAVSFGAVAAFVVVALAGVVGREPLSRVPDNALKLAVGVLLSATGAFWFGEAAGLAWPGDDLSLVALVAGFAATAALAIRLARPRAR